MIAHVIRPSAAAERLSGEGAFEVLARARELESLGHEIVHLEVGEPDFPTPAHVKRAGIAGIEADRTHYTPSAGIAPLRETIAAYAARFRGIAPFSPSEVVVAPGLKPLLWNVFAALLDPGDELVYADPAYPAYAGAAAYLQATPVRVPLRESNDFRLDVDELSRALTPRTKVLVLNSPQNPTGGVLTPGDLERIATLAIERDLTVVADEIYSRNLYDDAFASILQFDGMRERTILLDGFSKAYAMTGWRLGYGVMPAPIARLVALVGQNNYSCTTTFVQDAGIAALDGPDEPVRAMVDEFRVRRDRIVAGLGALPGVSCRTPRGAFYVFPNVREIAGDDDRALASFILEHAHVALIGGSAFGPNGRGHLRLSYANSLANIDFALARIADVLPRFRR